MSINLQFSTLTDRIDVIMNVGKSSIDKFLLQSRGDVEPPAKLGAGCVDAGLPPVYVGDGLSLWIADFVDPSLVLLNFHPPARLKVVETFPIQGIKVSNAAAHRSSVDKVKGFVGAERPILFEVLDQKIAVWRYPVGLNGAQVRTSYDGTWVFVCKFHRPDSCAGAVVEYPLHMGTDRSSIEPSADCQPKNMMMEIQSILLGLVVGQYVFPLLVGMISPTVLVLVAPDGGGDGCAV
jgi:hypothetical protein